MRKPTIFVSIVKCVRNTFLHKFANFVRLYFPQFTTVRNHKLCVNGDDFALERAENKTVGSLTTGAAVVSRALYTGDPYLFRSSSMS